MRSWLLLLGLCFVLALSVSAGQKQNFMTGKVDFCSTIQEEDGSPSLGACQTLKMTNGTLTDNGDGTFSFAGGGEWTDTGSILHPNEETVDEVVIGGTTEAGADIFLGVDGAAVFNEQSNSTGDFRVESDGDTHIFFMDSSEDTIGIGTNAPDFHLDIHHTADDANDISVHIDHDVNSFPSTVAMQIDLTATALGSEEEATGVVLNMDTADSAGGEMDAFTAVVVGTGSAEAHALRVGPAVRVIEQDSGVFANVGFCEIFDDSGSSFTDCVVAASSASTDVDIFVEDDDILYIGRSTQFSTISFDLAVGSGPPGIKPTFEHSITGDAFTAFGPLDTTKGMRENGVILMDLDVIGGDWVTATVDGDSAFWIRITRTRNTISPVPTENLIQLSATAPYEWDENGNIIALTFAFEGSSANAFEHKLDVINPTADRTFIFPNDEMVAGDVLVASDTSDLEYLNLATTEILIGDGSGIPTAAAISGDSTMTNGGVMTNTDLTCTNCINATEIEDIYVLIAGDTMTGDLTLDDGSGDSPKVTWTPATGTVWDMYVLDATDDLQIEVTTASAEVLNINNSSSGRIDLTIDGSITSLDLTTTRDVFVNGSDLELNTAGVKLTGDSDGSITFLGLGNGADEDFTLDLDNTANTVVVTSSTGMNKFDFAAIGLEINADINLTLGSTTIDENSSSDDIVVTNDMALHDASPSITLRDTSDNVAINIHVDSGNTDGQLAIYEGTDSGSGFTKGGNGLLVGLDTSGNVRFPALRGCTNVASDANGVLTCNDDDGDSRCAFIENLAAGDDNLSLGSFHRATTVTKVWCHFRGTGTTVAQISLEDGSGNAMTHVTPICTAEGTPPGSQDITAGGALSAREIVRFDVDNTPDPATDEYTICILASTT